MKVWKVILKDSSESKDQKNLNLVDIKSYFNGYLKIKRSYFNELTKLIKMSKKYITKRLIDQVISPENNEDWKNNPWMLLLAKETEKNMPFWFLIKREKDLSGVLVAFGPEGFVQFNEKQDISEARREIKRVISYLISYMNKFECIILLPNYLN